VRAYDDAQAVVAQSGTSFAAAVEVEIDLTTAKDGVVRELSTFSKLQARVAAQLHGTPLEDLKENKEVHELQFLAEVG